MLGTWLSPEPHGGGGVNGGQGTLQQGVGGLRSRRELARAQLGHQRGSGCRQGRGGRRPECRAGPEPDTTPHSRRGHTDPLRASWGGGGLEKSPLPQQVSLGLWVGGRGDVAGPLSPLRAPGARRPQVPGGPVRLPGGPGPAAGERRHRLHAAGPGLQAAGLGGRPGAPLGMLSRVGGLSGPSRSLVPANPSSGPSCLSLSLSQVRLCGQRLPLARVPPSPRRLLPRPAEAGYPTRAGQGRQSRFQPGVGGGEKAA